MLDGKWPETQVGIIHPLPLCLHPLACSWWSLLPGSVSFTECEETIHVIISSLLSPLCRDEWVFCLWNSHGGDFCFFFFFPAHLLSLSFCPPCMSHFKPCSGRRKPVSMCGWQEWGENWMYDLRLQEMAVYVAPLVLRGLQNEALNSNVLTHYSLEQRTSENTGVRSTEPVVSFTVYFWRNKLWHSTPRVAKFYLPERSWGGVYFRNLRRELVLRRGSPLVISLPPGFSPSLDGAYWPLSSGSFFSSDSWMLTVLESPPSLLLLTINWVPWL